VRIAELSRVTGVAVPTIKYYVREGLLPAGDRTNWNQVSYDAAHARRLTLIRTLVDVGGLSIAATRAVLDHLGARDTTLFGAIGKAHYATMPPRSEPTEAGLAERTARANGEVTALIERLGWRVNDDNPARQVLADVITRLRDLGQEDLLGLLDRYADLAGQVAADDIGVVMRREDPDGLVEAIVTWTVLGDTVFGALRRLAQESAAAEALGVPRPDEQAPCDE